VTEPRQCCHCQKFGNPPLVLPYLGEGRGHYWAHERCEHKAREEKRLAKPIPEVDFATYSDMQR
jgi:hypothetical protein